MMGKIVKDRSFSGCIKYILDKEKDTKLLDAQGIRLKSKASIIQSFVAQAKLRPKLGISVGHVSLSFSAEDKGKLSNEFLIKITREYMQKMGIVNTQYIVAQHFDKEHPHIHFCFNRINNNGETISDSKDQDRSIRICRELTEKYGLHIAEGKEKVKEHRLKEPDKTKYEIHNVLKDAIPQCKNWDQLTKALNRQGIEVKYKYNGQTDEKQGIIFMKNGYSFNGSKVDRMFSYSKIDFQLKQNVFSHDQSQNKNQQQSQPKDIIESTLDALSGIGAMQVHGDDYEEEAFKNRVEHEEQKRKKKQQFRRKF